MLSLNELLTQVTLLLQTILFMSFCVVLHFRYCTRIVPVNGHVTILLKITHMESEN